MINNLNIPRPNEVIDLLEAERPNATVYDTNVWRVVSEGRDPLTGYAAGGRWDDGTFDVLYTATEADGASAEAAFHAMRGNPVAPSKPKKMLFELNIEVSDVLDLSSTDFLRELGADLIQYGKLQYAEKDVEYPSLQQISEVAHFVGFRAILVPNARWACENLIVFTKRIKPEQISIVGEPKILNINEWYNDNATSSAKVRTI